jgi:hypothetical protein
MPDRPFDDSAAYEYVAALDKELNQDSIKQSSLEQRSSFVIASSGTLVTLLFGLSALVTKPENYQLPFAARIALVIALVLFLLAAVSALLVNAPARGITLSPTDLGQRLLDESVWSQPRGHGFKQVARKKSKILAVQQHNTRNKALLLLVALLFEILAIAAVSVGILVILTRGV